MDGFTGKGDRGTTDLIRTKNISKSDDRVRLLGSIDELSCHLGFVRSMMTEAGTIRFLEKIQGILIIITQGISDPYNREFRLTEERTKLIEDEMGRLEGMFDFDEHYVLPGTSRESAAVDIARAVARRAEADLASVGVKFGVDHGTKKFMNRLSSYLYVLARFLDSGAAAAMNELPVVSPAETVRAEANTDILDAVVKEVLKRIGGNTGLTLDRAKEFIQTVETEAKNRNASVSVAVCKADGTPAAVQSMDGAVPGTFDIALKRAVKAAETKQSTMNGGVPVTEGDTVIGAVGVCGISEETDRELADAAVKKNK